MKFIQEFKGKALSAASQFDVKNGDRTFYFVKRSVGKAVYIYGEYIFASRNVDMNDKLELYAIVSSGNVYLVNTYHFDRDKENGYPEKVFSFSNKVAEINDYISNELFTKYYNNLPIRELTENEESEVKRNVRMTVLYDGGVVDDLKIEKVMKVENVAKVLRGEMTVEGFAHEYFEKYRDGYITTKSMINKKRKLATEKYNVQEWEIAMADALLALDAKTVTVDFCFNGQLGTEKIEKPTLLREIYNNGDFSAWDFANSKKGEALLKKLGVGRYGTERKDLKCEHIESVRYGRNVIYSKQSFQNERVIS